MSDVKATDTEVGDIIALAAGGHAIPIVMGALVTSAMRELLALRQTTEIALNDAAKADHDRINAQADAARYKRDHDGACKLVAKMHEAAVGDVRGPRRGVVEDVADLRTAAIRTRIALDEALELNDKIDEIYDAVKSARDTLGAIALQNIDPKDQVTRKRVEALLKAGNAEVDQTSTTIVKA